MDEKQIEKVENSKGYKVLFEALNKSFNQMYEVKEIIYDSDFTSFDFRLIIDFPNLSGVDIGVSGSGPSQMFRLGDSGVVGISIPNEDGLGILPSGFRGKGLASIIQNPKFRFGASIDSPENINQYFTLFKDYYNKYYC